MIQRIKNKVGKDSIKKIADSLYTSKLRYGLPLFGKIKWNVTDTQEKWLKDLQLNQNKMLRLMNGTRIKDKISTKSILKKFDLLSVNQMNAQIKLLDMWKATNIAEYPTKVKTMEINNGASRATTRSITNGKLLEIGISSLAKDTFYNDAVKAWNAAPEVIKNCTTIWTAKKQIKSFVKSLPI